MKARLLMFAVAAVMMAFTACTNEKIVYVEQEEATGGIELQPGEGIVNISLAGTMSRAARPITSNDAVHNVDRIMFKFMTSSDGKETEVNGIYVDGIVDANGDVIAGTTDGGTTVIITNNGNIDMTNIKVKFSGMEAGQSFNICAFGYNSNVSGTFPFELTYDSDYKWKCSLQEGVNEIDELFVGIYPNGGTVTINKDGLFDDDITITLQRQVAGLMAYMKEVPVHINVKDESNKEVPTKVTKITIASVKSVEGIYVPNSIRNNSDLNGYGDDHSDLDHLLTFDLTSSNTEVNITAGNDGYYHFVSKKDDEVKYLLAKENVEAGTEFGFDDDKTGTFKPGTDDTLYGCCFMFAYGSTYSSGNDDSYPGTLNICYWNEGKVIKTVPLKSSEEKFYNIKCNNFYAIGNLSKLGDQTVTDNPLSIDEESGYYGPNVTIFADWGESHQLTNK